MVETARVVPLPLTSRLVRAGRDAHGIATAADTHGGGPAVSRHEGMHPQGRLRG